MLYSDLQNDMLTGGTHTVEIKVDPPADGNADGSANADNTVTGTDAILSAIQSVA